MIVLFLNDGTMLRKKFNHAKVKIQHTQHILKVQWQETCKHYLINFINQLNIWILKINSRQFKVKNSSISN